MRLLLDFFCDPPVGTGRAPLLRRTLAAFGLALVAVTWRLWTPQHVFPQVPFFRALVAAPAWCDWAGASGMVVGLLASLVAPLRGPWAARALVLFAVSTTGMCLLDQERLQPWAYQFVIVAVVLALAEPRAALGLLRLLIVSFYLHSALSKFDYSFLHTLGQQFLAALAGVVGASVDGWSESSRLAAAAMFPLGELLIAAGLCFARTRRAALVAAIVMHMLLLTILGPWGMNHRPGVLIWNVYFMVQNVLLFWSESTSPAAVPSEVEPSGRRTAAPLFVQSLVLAAVALPLLAPTTWFDVWPAWGLYAPCAERVTLLVHRRGVEQLPAELQSFAEAPQDPRDPWRTLRLDRWSLEALGAPIYPQNRYQLGVAEAVIARYRLGHLARVVRLPLARRISGERSGAEGVSAMGLPQVIAAAGDYLFNSRPRQALFASTDEAQ